MSGRVVSMPPMAAHALWARTYDANPNPLLLLEERSVQSLLPPLHGLLVLDVACGTGRWLAHLARCGSKTGIGVDLSPEMLRQASRKPSLATYLIEADCMAMPVLSCSADFAISSFCLGYVPNLRELAGELARVLRDGSQLVVSDFHPSAHARGWKRSFRHEDAIVEISSFNRPLESIVNTFANEGFRLDVCLEPEFGEADRLIFEQYGKRDLFSEVLGKAAIFVCRFRRAARRAGFAVPKRRARTVCGENSPAARHAAATRSDLRGDRESDHPITSFWLVGGTLAVSSCTAVRANIEITDGRITRVVHGDPAAVPCVTDPVTVNLEGYLILPGLINAHDHLEFNLFPRLGRGLYPNSEAWARDVCQPDRTPVREHLAVPKSVRLWWGGLKNLLSGVTTVCHHNPYDPVFDDGFPVRVVRRYGWAHSLVFDKDVIGAFGATHADAPFVIHLGEGTDKCSEGEIFTLDRMGALDGRTVLVHGVGFTDSGHTLWQERGAALIWCPTSNRFILGATLDGERVSRFERTALGSDSALTGRGTLLDEIRAAYCEEGAGARSIYQMVTEGAAEILRLTEGEGQARPGSIADLVAIPWRQRAPAEAVTEMDMAQVEMVLVSGKLQLASPAMVSRWPQRFSKGLEAISIEGMRRSVRAPVSRLANRTSHHLRGGIFLAGRRVSA